MGTGADKATISRYISRVSSILDYLESLPLTAWSVVQLDHRDPKDIQYQLDGRDNVRLFASSEDWEVRGFERKQYFNRYVLTFGRFFAAGNVHLDEGRIRKLYTKLHADGRLKVEATKMLDRAELVRLERLRGSGQG